MTNSIIAIKGNHLDKVSSIFATFNYIDNKADKQFDSVDNAVAYLSDNYFSFADKNIAIRGIWECNGWTLIHDPEMVDAADDNVMESLAKNINSDIYSFLIQTTSGTFGFTKFNPSLTRQFLSSEGNIAQNDGEPIAEESGLNINGKIFIDDIIKLANKLGIDIEGKTPTTVIVKELGYNEILKKQLEQFAQKPNQKLVDTQKPLWKIW